jgi:hypothetical protein
MRSEQSSISARIGYIQIKQLEICNHYCKNEQREALSPCLDFAAISISGERI